MRKSMVIRLVIATMMALCVAQQVQAQDGDDDIAYSLSLPETVVLPEGMSFEEYLVKRVLDNAKPLKDRVERLSYHVTCQLEKDIDLTTFPHRRTITFVARLAGYGPIISALREHKHFGITMAEDVLFNKGKITTSNVRMVEMKQELTEKQVASFLKHDGMMSANVYDKFYKKVREKAKELQKKRRKNQELLADSPHHLPRGPERHVLRLQGNQAQPVCAESRNSQAVSGQEEMAQGLYLDENGL